MPFSKAQALLRAKKQGTSLVSYIDVDRCDRTWDSRRPIHPSIHPTTARGVHVDCPKALLLPPAEALEVDACPSLLDELVQQQEADRARRFRPHHHAKKAAAHLKRAFSFQGTFAGMSGSRPHCMGTYAPKHIGLT